MSWTFGVNVAVAVITDEAHRVLITRRALHAPQGGFWEFPGGKLEADELPATALIREIKEEVGLQVKGYHFLGTVCHSYDDKSVSLLVYHVDEFDGQAVCCEGQMDLRWVAFDELAAFDFPAANQKILGLVRQYTHRT